MKSSNVHQSLNELLERLQVAMIGSGIWAQQAPSSQALSSTQPFCIDTLSFEQWLQFVMVVKFEVIIAQSLKLPAQSDMTSMAEEAFKDRKLELVIGVIRDIDNLLNSFAK